MQLVSSIPLRLDAWVIDSKDVLSNITKYYLFIFSYEPFILTPEFLIFLKAFPTFDLWQIMDKSDSFHKDEIERQFPFRSS